MSYFKANMHKIRFQNTRPRTGGAHSAPPDPLLDLMGPTSKGREGKTGGLEEREGEGGWVRKRGKAFSLYLSISGLQKGPGKFLMGVLESPGKVLDFFYQ